MKVVQTFKLHWQKYTVIFISLSYTIFLLSPVLLTIFNKPNNTVNMFVGHYYEDYYEYLSFIKQGQLGHVLLQNYFTNDDASTFFIGWWPFSLLGYISYMFKLSIFTPYVYWIASAFFCFAFFMLYFHGISKTLNNTRPMVVLGAFLLVLFSSGFVNITNDHGLRIILFEHWGSYGSPFARYNIGTPQHQLTQIIFLLCLLSAIAHQQSPNVKMTIVFFLLSLLLLLLSPSHLLLFLASYLISLLVFTFAYRSYSRKTIGWILASVFAVFAALLPFAFFISKHYLNSPTLASSPLSIINRNP